MGIFGCSVMPSRWVFWSLKVVHQLLYWIWLPKNSQRFLLYHQLSDITALMWQVKSQLLLNHLKVNLFFLNEWTCSSGIFSTMDYFGFQKKSQLILLWCVTSVLAFYSVVTNYLDRINSWHEMNDPTLDIILTLKEKKKIGKTVKKLLQCLLESLQNLNFRFGILIKNSIHSFRQLQISPMKMEIWYVYSWRHVLLPLQEWGAGNVYLLV